MIRCSSFLEASSRKMFSSFQLPTFGTGTKWFRRKYPPSPSTPPSSLRQPQECSEKDSARTPARGDDAIHRFPIALGFPVRVLHTGRSSRERRRGRTRRRLSPEPFGARAEGRQLEGTEHFPARSFQER